MSLLVRFPEALVDKSGVFPADIISPWFSMIIYDVGDEQ
jgi:hypothetical protein